MHVAVSREIPSIWTPGQELEPPAGHISPELVRASFKSHVAPIGTEIVSLANNSLSALVVPEEMPSGFLFVDIDDFLLDLSGSLQGIQHANIKKPTERYNNHDYGEGMFFRDEQTTVKHALISLIKQSRAGMQPAPSIYDIRKEFKDMRAKGVYICFLSVSTPGSELFTIENFLGQYFRGVGDGLVIIKGDYRKADKGTEAANVIRFAEEQTNQELSPGMPVVVMDDWPSHLKKMRTSITNLDRGINLVTIQNTFPSSQMPERSSVQKDSVLSSTQYASVFLGKNAKRRPTKILIPTHQDFLDLVA